MATTALHLYGGPGKPWTFTAKTEATVAITHFRVTMRVTDVDHVLKAANVTGVLRAHGGSQVIAGRKEG